MAARVYEGKHNVYWLTVLPNINAPTVAQITAGIDLSDHITKDGIAVNISTNNVDNTSITTTFDAQLVGSDGADLQLTLKRGDASGGLSDLAWTTWVGGTHGFLVIDRVNASGTLPSVGNIVEAYPAQMHRKAMENSAANTQQKFIGRLAVTDNYNSDAVVA